MTQPVIFISYSHKDEDWKDQLLAHLGIARQQDLFDVWDDRRIEGGEDWFRAITDAIDAGAIGILLVSANSLSSKFILNEEVPRLLAHRDAGTLRLYPIVIKPCNWQAVPWLKQMNLRPRDGRPVGVTAKHEFSDTQRDIDLTAIAQEIDTLIQKLTAPPPAPQPADAAPRYVKIPTLPAPRPFVGRADNLDEIERRLRQGGAIGPIILRGGAGVGKTALALESAYRFGALFPGGRYWVDLRGGDAAIAVRALLRDLGIADRAAPDSQLDDLCFLASNQLADMPSLVVLDNAETIDADARNRLAELCATTIITSRVAIDATTDIYIDRLSDADALALLGQRGVDAIAEHDDALKLIARLGGLALALEITAKRMATYRPRQTCAQAIDEFNRNRHIVTALNLPNRNTRDENLAEAFALSYLRLDEAERALFHAAGLCAQTGAPLEALCRMTDSEPNVTRDRLLRLTEMSLADFDGKRIVMHPLLHDYAEHCAEQQAAAAEEMILRHAQYFGVEVGGSLERAIGNDAGEVIDKAFRLIDDEINNVTLSQTRALRESFTAAKIAVEITYNLRQYWNLRYEPNRLDWFYRARQIAQQTGQQHHEANVLQAIGDVQSFRKQMDEALASYDAALKLFQQVGDNLGQANVLKAIGDVQSFRDQKDEALASYDAALKLFQQVGDNLGQANVLQAIGDVQSFRKQMDEALASYDAALKLFQQVGSNLGQANVLKAIGDVQSFRDQKDEALASYDAALKLFQQVGSNLGQANVLQAIGDVQSFRDQKDEALASYDAALKLFQQVGDNLGQANVLKAIGDVQSFRKQMDEALASYDAALKLFQQVGSNLGQANVLKAIGDVQSFRDQKDEALASYDAALKLFQQVGDNLGQANVLQAIGDVQSFRKQMDEALASYDAALKLFQQVGSNLGQANVLKAIGDVQSFRDQKDEALASYDAALKLFQQVGDNLGQANVLQAIGDVQSFRDQKDEALASYDAALKLFQQVGSNLGQANVLKAIGDVQSFRKQMDEALASYDAALKLFQQVGDNLGQANVLLARAQLDDREADFEEAIRLYEQVRDVYSIARGKAYFGKWLLKSGDAERGRRLLKEAREGFLSISFEPGVEWVDDVLNNTEED